MKNKLTMKTAAMFLALVASTAFVDAKTISGKVTNAKGKAIEGVTVSAFTKDFDKIKTISVFSQSDGAFAIDGLRNRKYWVRARLMGQLDEWQKDVDAGATGLSFAMKPAKGKDLENQRTANSGFSMLKWDSLKDKDNYKTY